MRPALVRRPSPAFVAGLVLAMAIASGACSDESSIGPGKVVLIRISPDTVRLVVGGVDTARAFPIDAEGAFLANKRVRWSTGDAGIAQITDQGEVTGVALGEVDLTATTDNISASVRVLVTPAPVIGVDVDSVPFTAIAQSGDSPTALVTVTNTGGGLLTDLGIGTIVYQGTATGWVSATLDQPNAPATLSLAINSDGLGVGTHVATVQLTSDDSPNSPFAVQVVLTLTSDVATNVAPQAGDNQTGAAGTAVPVPPSVLVTDQYGNPVTGAAVTFAVGTGGGSIVGGDAVSGADGIAAVGSWTLGSTVGGNSLTATATGLSGSPIAFNATGVAGSASQIAVNGGSGQTAVAGQPVVVAPSAVVRDGFNNPVSGVAVTFAIASGGGSITGGAQTTNASGIATIGSWTLGTTAGPNSLGVTSTGLTGSPLSVTATGVAGTATTVAINAGNGQSAAAGTGVPLAPSVRVTDANSNGVAGTTVTFLVASGGGSVTGGAPVTNASGIAAVTGWQLGNTVGANSLSATAPGLTGSPLSFTATGVTGPEAILAVNAGNNQAATAATTVPVNPSVLVTDGFGNPVQGVAVTFAVASGGGSLTAGTQSTNSSGIATVGSWTLGATAGVNTLTATSAGLSGSPILFTATGNPGNATNLALVAGDGQTGTVGAALATALSVLVTDNLTNPVAGVTVGWASGSGSLNPASSVTNASGVATTSWTLGTTPGAVSATGSVGGLIGSPINFSATANVGPPTIISQSAGNGQSATVNTAVAIAPAALVTDQFGNPLTGVSVTFAPTLGGGAVAGGAQTTSANGIATVTSWTLGQTAGANTLSATATGAGSTSFTATGTAGAATQIAINAGNGQSATVGTTVATAPRVLVRDQFNNPVSNVAVAFAVTGGGGSATGGSQTSDASGLATLTSWTLGQTAGANSLSATSAGLTGSPLSFTATGTAGAVTTIVANGSFPGSGTAGIEYAPDPSVIAQDQFSNPVPSVAITFTRGGSSLVNCGAGNTTACNVTTSAAGVATVLSWTLGTTAGSNSLSATRAGATGVTFSVTGNPGPVDFFSLTAGNGQTARPGQQASTDPSITARDVFGNTVPSTLVTFSVTAGGGTVSCGAAFLNTCSATTNASGVATTSGWIFSNSGAPANGLYSNQLTVSRPGATSGTFSGDARWSFANDVQPIFTANCTGCHPSPFLPDLRTGFTYAANRGVASNQCAGFTRVVAGFNQASASLLYTKLISASTGCGVRMPQGGPFLSATVTNIVRDWIDNNSPNN